VPPDFEITGRTWYVAATNEKNPSHDAVWSDPYLDAAQNGFVITSSAPIYDPSGQFRGVVGIDIQLKKITDIVSRIKIGSTGYAILIDQNGNVLSIPPAGYKDFGADPGLFQSGNILNLKNITPGLPGFSNILNKMISGESGLEKIKIENLEKYIVYRPIPSVKSSLAIIVPANELLSSAITAKEQLSLQTARTISFSVYLVLAILIAAIIASFAIANMYTAPLRELTHVAHQIANGNLEITADVKSQDEIGSLANAINTMTITLRTLINSLEQRVAERTTKLQEHSDALEENTIKTQKRANQLQTVAQVGRTITSVQSIDDLLPKISHVISTQFNYYHVGIFIQEPANEYTELKAASSEGGYRMLARGHKLRIGEMGIVGYVAATGVARIALDIGADPVFFNNPDLPNTRSEIALPLKVGADIIGVLDVQSEKPSAFSSEESEILQILADQVSIAIQNSRRYQTSQKSIAEAQSIVRQYIRTEWQSIEEDEIIGYRFSKEGSHRIVKSFDPLTNQNSIPQMRNKEKNISIPIILHDQTIGTLNLSSRSGQAWDQDALDISKAVADHVAIAVENARLLDSSQTRAARERTVSEITAKIGASVNMRNVLQTAVEELGRILPGSDVIIQLESGKSNGDQKPSDLEQSS
jgi:GAF domain-containing protein